MPLESVTHISDLNIANPPGTDGLSQADDHIRNLKIALKTDFPGITGVVNATQAQLNLLNSIAGLSLLANNTIGPTAPVAVTAAANGNIFRRASSILAFGTIDLADINSVLQPLFIVANTSTLLVTASTALVDIPGTNPINLVTAALYSYEAFYKFTTVGAAGVRFGNVYTNTPQEDDVQVDYVNSTPAHSEILSTSSTSQGIAGSAGETFIVHVRGRLRANAATGGTFNSKAACNAAVGSASLTQFWLRLERIS